MKSIIRELNTKCSWNQRAKAWNSSKSSLKSSLHLKKRRKTLPLRTDSKPLRRKSSKRLCSRGCDHFRAKSERASERQRERQMQPAGERYVEREPFLFFLYNRRDVPEKLLTTTSTTWQNAIISPSRCDQIGLRFPFSDPFLFLNISFVFKILKSTI